MKYNLITLVLLLLSSTSALITHAEEIPMNPDIRYGKLENGLTYYILHNEEPKERASFYIIQNVGAMLEEDHQDGLAHFLEHMAFNGTKNFPGKGLIEYLETYGVAFGRNINAYTSLDETVYNISNVPVGHQPLLDSCLLVLHDWSNHLSLEEEEIDAERGVIREEWRTRRNVSKRIRDQRRTVLMAGSKYAKRDVIGSLDVINNFEYDALRQFYHDWYRTDLQAIAIVGDIDVDDMEAKVKALFSTIPAVENPLERKYYDVLPNSEPLYVLATDKEQKKSEISLSAKHPGVDPENKDYDYLRTAYVKSFFRSMLNQRFSERMQEEVPPYLGASSFEYSFTKKTDVTGIQVSFRENQWESNVAEALKEFERVRRYGFTESELNRTKINFLKGSENSYKNREKRSHDQHIGSIKNHYIKQSPLMSAKYSYDFAQEEIPTITLEEVNEFANYWLADQNNFMISITGPEKEGVSYPKKEEVLALIQKVRNDELDPYVDSFVEKPLLNFTGKPSPVAKTEKLEELDATAFTLENGATIVVKHTEFNKNSISFSAFSNGGSSLYEKTEIPSVPLFNSFIGEFGLGEFSKNELSKALTGKTVSVNPSLSSLYENLSGSSTPEDLETLLQLTYMYFEHPRFDRKAFDSYMKRVREYNKNYGKDPSTAYADTIQINLYGKHPRVKPFSPAVLDEITFEGIERIYRERFADASDFVFLFVGNIDIEKAIQLFEKYIGAIKSENRNEEFVDNGVRYAAKDTKVHFEREMGTPKASVHVSLVNDHPYSMEDNYLFYMIAQLLNKQYITEIREKEGGTYGVQVRPTMSELPNENIRLAMQFDCKPEDQEKLTSIIYREIELLKQGQVNTVSLEDIKKNMIKSRQEMILRNGFWMTSLKNHFQERDAYLMGDEYVDYIMGIDSEAIIRGANTMLNDAKTVEVVMKGTIVN